MDKVSISLSYSTQIPSGQWIKVETSTFTQPEKGETNAGARERAYLESKKALDRYVKRMIKDASA